MKTIVLSFLFTCLLSTISAWVEPDLLLPYVDELRDNIKISEEDVPARFRRSNNKQNAMMVLVDFIFEDADANGDEQLNHREFARTFNLFDSDGDKKIVLEEYVAYFLSGNLPGVNAMTNLNHVAARLFFAGDINTDGVLDQHDASIIFGRLDGNGDGFVSHMEYSTRWGRVLAMLAHSRG